MRAAALAAAVVALAGAGCGGDDPTPTPGAVEDGSGHIHGVGVNPADGSLMIATHSGMFRAGARERHARRLGDRRQDTMGFTVVGDDQFLGSGHPDARDDLPPLLGLIRSDDAGRSWDSISLLGEADFHVLRTAGTRIYGVNATDGRLMVSDDGGRGWATRTPPGPLLDLAAHPNDPDRLLAAGERGLYVSPDAGKGWRPLTSRLTGLIVWTGPEESVLVDASGNVHRSRNSGRTWRRAGQIDGRPAALATHSGDLYVATHENEVFVSSDDGRTWRLRATAA